MLLEVKDPGGPPEGELISERSSRARSAGGNRKTGANTMPLGARSRQRAGAPSGDNQDDNPTRQHGHEDGTKIKIDHTKIEQPKESPHTSPKKRKNEKPKMNNADWAYSLSRSPPRKYICRRCGRPGKSWRYSPVENQYANSPNRHQAIGFSAVQPTSIQSMTCRRNLTIAAIYVESMVFIS